MAVINGADALLAKKVVVDDISFTPSVFQLIAMDVNGDGRVTAGDVSQINQRTTLMIGEFKNVSGSASKDWLFVDDSLVQNSLGYRISSTYPANDLVGFSKYLVPVIPAKINLPYADYAGCPEINGGIYDGILLGDVDGNYRKIAADGILKKGAANGDVIFDLSKATVNGNLVSVPVSVSSDNSINSLDFSTKFNMNNLTFESVQAGNNLSQLAYFNTADNTLRVTSYSLQDYNVNEPVIFVNFTTNDGKLSNTELNSVKAYLNGEAANVQLVEPLGISEINFNNLVKVYPNPTSEVLNVEVPEISTVQLLDISGQQITKITDVTKKIELNVQNLASGIYMIKISNNSNVATKKVVIKH